MKKALLVMSFCLVLSLPTLALAQNSIIDPTAPQYESGDYQLNDIVALAINASRYILGIVGSLALIMFIYGGFVFLTSGGSSDKVASGKKILIAAAIGLVIVFSSYVIIRFVLQSLGLNWKGEVKKMTPTAAQNQ